MKIFKSRDVKTPTRGTKRSAGLDFYMPNMPESIVYLDPGETIKIPSGIFVEVPRGFVLIAFNRSSIAVNKRLQVGACVIDEDYEGEIFINLTNIGPIAVTLSPNEKIIQFLLLPSVHTNLVECDDIKDLYVGSNSDRSMGGFGSTNIM